MILYCTLRSLFFHFFFLLPQLTLLNSSVGDLTLSDLVDKPRHAMP